MSILIDCPHCGRRPLEEFLHGEIPVVPDSLTDDDERDVDRAFMRANPEGENTERWFHLFGCRRWLTPRRDTRTDEILHTSGTSSAAPKKETDGKNQTGDGRGRKDAA